jgi:hypothetical protein
MKMPTYNIEFVLNGQTKPCVLAFKASTPGGAQKRFFEKFPGGKILRQWREARINGCRFGRVMYEAVSIVAVEPLRPVSKVEETVFPFFNQCLSTKQPEKSGIQPAATKLAA